MRLVSAVLNVSLTQGGFTKLKINQGGARPSLVDFQFCEAALRQADVKDCAHQPHH